MSPEGKGFLKVIALGEQTAFDTEVAAYTNFLIFNDESLVQTKTPLEPDEVHGEAGREISEEGRITVGGDIGVNLRPEGGAWLLMKHAFGTLASSQPDSSGAPSVYQHDFTLANELPINGLSVKVDRDIAVFSYLGMKVQSVGFSYAMDAPGLVTTFTLVGHSEALGGAAPSPVYTTQVFWKDYQGVFLMDGIEQRISAFDLTIANSMREDDFRSGSQYRAQIERAGQRDISGTFSRRYIDNVLYNKFLNWERAILRFTFTADAIEGGFSYQLVMNLPVVQIQGSTPGTGGVDMGPQDVSFRALRDTTTPAEEVSLTLTNTESDY